MTVVADEMLIRIAADTAQLRNDMKDMQRSVGGSFDDIKDRASSLKSTLVNVFAGLAVGALAKQFVETADAMALLDARLKQTTGDAETFAEAQKEIYRIAQANNLGLQEATELFVKMNEPVKRLGGGTKETAAIVESFSTALRLGGASAAEAASATLQFGQAMGSGVLQGGEFNAMAEASPRLLKAIAEGANLPIEQLKKMGSEGKLTADVVGNALIKSLDQLKSESGNMPDTVGGAFQRMKNDIMVAVNELNQNSGLTLGIAGLISGVNELVPTIKAELAGAFEAVGEWIGRNRDDVGEVWETVKGVMADVWELAKGFASVVGFVVEVGVQSGAFKTILETIRLLVAGLQDGVKIIGAAFAMAGADIIDFFTTPLQGVLKLIGTLADKVGLDFGKSLISAADGMDRISKDARKYGENIFEAFKNGDTAVNKLNAELLKNKEAANAASSGNKVASEVMDALAGTADKAGGALVTLKGKSSELSKEQKAAADAYDKLIKSVSDKNAAMAGELTQQAKLTDGQKMALKVMNEIRDGTLKLTSAQKIKATAALEDMLATERLTDAQKDELALQKELRDQRAKETDALFKQADAMDEQTQKILDENAVLQGLAKSVEELELARLKDKRAIMEQIVAQEKLKGYCDAETEANRRTLRSLNDLIDARENNVHLKAAKESSEEWKKTADSMSEGLTDALMRGFESGKGFLQNFKDSAINMSKTLVLKPRIEGVMSGIFGGGGGLLGGEGGSGGSGGGIMDLISGGKSVFDMITGGFNSFSAGVTSNIASIGEWFSGAGMEGIGGLLGENALMLGNFAGALGGVGAGMGLGGLISGKYSLGGSKNLATGLGSAIGMLGGPLGSVLGGAIGGLVNRAFGRGPKEYGDSGIEGTFGYGDFLGHSYADWKQKGGWFRSDKKGTEMSALDSDREMMMDTSARALLDSVKGLAVGLGLEGKNVEAASLQFRLALTGNAEQDQAAITGVLTQYRDALAQQYASALVPFQKTGEALYDTLQRLATVQLSREMLNQFGGIFSTIASSGVEATEAMLSLAGGLDALIGKAQSFVQDFYTQQEQAGMGAKGIVEQLAGLGLDVGGISSKEQYRALVEGINVNSQTGREQLNALLTLGPQFASIAEFMSQNQLTLAELATSAPLIEALDPLFAMQAEAANQSAASIDATTAAVTGVQSAVTAGTSATVAAINGLAGSIQSAISSVAQSSATATAALSARLESVESNARLAASAPY